ncbi:hypothetical protein [Cellulomonas pakistanensis]|uniref:Uncharacterized protein n=1 Tax=Cellulomonas pakistanensis TaxID=992287 RepID=A0A919U3U7_9CELL|nr:hypothetical protein [Cellulomonas pakistanensis]GIG37643.1 hypothetical protein Cpa01nite_30240 [Cellulomonas pakistanensis]
MQVIPKSYGKLIIMTAEEMREKREQELASIGLDLETIEERYETWQLSPEQRIAYEEYLLLGRLLGE